MHTLTFQRFKRMNDAVLFRGKMKEVIFIGIPGPTYNFSGLAYGNVAESKYEGSVSQPKLAAIQSLKLAAAILERDITVGILPPLHRPDLALLKHIGYEGAPEKMIETAGEDNYRLLANICASSNMWIANSATIAPSVDTNDGKVHITPANLQYNFHRTLEAKPTYGILKQVFADAKYFTVHPPLPSHRVFGDEGAANHTRLAPTHDSQGMHIFVYGKRGFRTEQAPVPKTYPARHTLAASEAVSRKHKLAEQHTLFLQQHPDAIDAGVFHNDVIAVGNEHVFFCHENAYLHGSNDIGAIQSRYHDRYGKELTLITASSEDVSYQEAVETYLFNSQIITRADGSMSLLAPEEVKHCKATAAIVKRVQADPNNPIDEVVYFDLKESMHNGGGPACLRLRVLLNEDQLASVRASSNVIVNKDALSKLEAWVEENYPDKVEPDNLADPNLYKLSKQAISKLEPLLGIRI